MYFYKSNSFLYNIVKYLNKQQKNPDILEEDKIINRKRISIKHLIDVAVNIKWFNPD